MLVNVDHLVGAAEIGEMLGISRQRVNQLSNRKDFPTPVVVLRMGKIWRTEDIEKWQKDREPRLRKAKP